MKIHVDTLDSRIETDNEKLLKALIQVYSFKQPGAYYSTSYKRGGWDGKKHFITPKGKFKTGLLPKLLEDLKKIGCDPEIIDTRKRTLNISDHKISSFTYYDFQEELIIKALEKKRCVIKSPTGSGKTLIMAGIIKALENYNITVLFNSKQLLTQTYEFLKKCGIKNVGLNFGEGFEFGSIMLSTVQSIERIIDTHVLNTDVLLVDECHEFCSGEVALGAIQSFPNSVYRIGFSATPPTKDIPLFNLLGALGEIVEVVSAADLVESGHLTKPIIQLIKGEYSCSGIDNKMSYMQIYDTFIVHNKVRNNKIVEIVNLIKENNKDAKILILVKSLEHGAILKNLIKYDCDFLEGANNLVDRYEVISKFKDTKGSRILIGTKILQTGINIEEITHFINARGLKSEAATLQALGRALRKHESKSKVFIYDFLDQEKYLKTHSNSRKNYYKKEGHEINIL